MLGKIIFQLLIRMVILTTYQSLKRDILVINLESEMTPQKIKNSKSTKISYSATTQTHSIQTTKTTTQKNNQTNNA